MDKEKKRLARLEWRADEAGFGVGAIVGAAAHLEAPLVGSRRHDLPDIARDVVGAELVGASSEAARLLDVIAGVGIAAVRAGVALVLGYFIGHAIVVAPGVDAVACLAIEGVPVDVYIGAWTKEAEDNCAVMVADQVRSWLEDGNVHNAVNFPAINLPRNGGYRIAVVNSNVPNMVGQISTDLAKVNLNILDMLNRSRGDIAVTLIDVNQRVPEETVTRLRSIEGVLSVRCLGCEKR